jgi:hypothetical protein
MDAQNASGSASSKPAASDKTKKPSEQSTSLAQGKLSNAARTSPSKDQSGKATVRDGDKKASANDDDAGVDVSSEAETVVLPGKDGHSPSKVRKPIKIEDRKDGDNTTKKSGDRPLNPPRTATERDRSREDHQSGNKPGKSDKSSASVVTGAAASGSTAASVTAKKKNQPDKSRNKDGSSGLSSAPASPPVTDVSRRSPKPAGDSDTESSTTRAFITAPKERSRTTDKVASQKRKAPKAESDDDGESRKARRPRTSLSGTDGAEVDSKQAGLRDAKTSLGRGHDNSTSSLARSVSPHPRSHRRSVSTQLTQSSSGLSHKKKRVPAPLQSMDYNSDESSASNSPHPRSSKLRGMATPATGESNISPAKMAPHKKHVDAHGQTFLARACARGEYDNAKTRLTERPEDLNHPDYAGNTPLQIAAINGYADIVKLLVDAGCNLDCMNNDKDTPLLDAVDNDHLSVVKVLLDAGVNPRKANVNGEEPLDRVRDDQDNASEIRAALVAAKQRMGDRRRTSEDHQDPDTHSSHGAESPRRSPGAGVSALGSSSTRRGGTVRANKTSNHLLYMPMDDKTLRQAAGRGDQETVERILQVRDSFDDPESMVAAARGGHDIIMELLLALGGANPDPGPVNGLPADMATPMLAAIGQENIQVIKLLLSQHQSKFDPTRRFKGETYYEIARKRQGTNWKEEEQLLKAAYDEHKKQRGKGASQHKSPIRSKDAERDAKRSRSDAKDSADRLHKRKASSPARDGAKAGSSKTSSSPRDKRRAESTSTHADDQVSPKRGPGRPRKDDRGSLSGTADDASAKPTAKSKKADSDLGAIGGSSDGEAVKPRRKLVSGRELKGERERQRRPSVTSTGSSLKEPSSPSEIRHDKPSEKKVIKVLDRTKALKRDESIEKSSSTGDASSKRHRTSATPPLHGASEREPSEAPPKRRKLDGDGNEKRRRLTMSPEDRVVKGAAPRESSVPAGKATHKERDDAHKRTAAKLKKTDAVTDPARRESGKSTSSEKSIHVKSEEPDVEMRDAEPLAAAGDDTKALETQLKNEEEDRNKLAEQELLAEEMRKKDEEQRRVEEEDKRRTEAEYAKQRAADEARRKKEEEDAAVRRQEEAERQRKDDEERKKREEEERQRKEEEDRKRREAEEAEALRREEERKRQEEVDRQQREEEERLHREQLEREAAEEARRRKEEEERRERLLREEADRRRAAREAEMRRLREEQERIRLAKLPPLLHWLDQCPNPKLANIAEKFSLMQGVRFDCIVPERTGHPDGREQWLLNTQVALLLGEKDLELSRCKFSFARSISRPFPIISSLVISH